MRKLYLPTLILTASMLFSSCEEDNCVSCISENAEGIIMAHEVECHADDGYPKGYRDGFKEREEAKGYTVTCSLFDAE